MVFIGVLVFNSIQLYAGDKENLLNTLQQIEQTKKRINALKAEENINHFFSERTSALWELSLSCQAQLSTIEAACASLVERSFSVPRVFSLEDFETLLSLFVRYMVEDSQTRSFILNLQKNLYVTQLQIQNLNSQLNLNKKQLLYLYPLPYSEPKKDQAYLNALWNHFQTAKLKFEPTFQQRSEPCLKINFDLSFAFERRQDLFNKEFKSLGERYVDFYEELIKSKNQTKEDSIKIASDVRTGLAKLDLHYQKEIVLNTDRYKALEILGKYEEISSVFIGLLAPAISNDSIKKAVDLEIQTRLIKAREIKFQLEKESPITWVVRRYEIIQKKKKTCDVVCKKKFDLAEKLIGAAQVVGDIAPTDTYTILANAVLDQLDMN